MAIYLLWGMAIVWVQVIATILANIQTSFRWPEGEYGILSREKCPAGWHEFSHCIDTEDTLNEDNIKDFKLSLGKICGYSSVGLRYCFKGSAIPTRKGGFWTQSARHGVAYLIKNVNSSCEVFGQFGGSIYIDDEDTKNSNSYGTDGLNRKMPDHYQPDTFLFGDNTFLIFCIIGGAKRSANSEYIEVGEFNKQNFGFFIHPQGSCPILKSPYGILKGKKEEYFLDNEDFINDTKYAGKTPFVTMDSNIKGAACQYDPSNVQ